MFSGLLSLAQTLLSIGGLVSGRPSVSIRNGTILGVDLPNLGQHVFLGIPFAQAPVGELRLRAPQPIVTPLGDFDASRYGAHCWGGVSAAFDDNKGYESSEDCLTLNVVRPYVATAEKPVPVVVWIHGGGFFTGGSGDSRYNGSFLVEASVANGNPIVFVSINYRLSSLGFLAGRALASEGSLNLGLRDQRLALHWVQENIARFGGDPKKVTIQGESAGGASVHAHVVAYSGRDDHLFHQAIPQSGTFGQKHSAPDAPQMQATYDKLLSSTTCAQTAEQASDVQLACIRALPIQEFREATGGGMTGLVADGDLLDVGSALDAYKKGNWVKVPHLIGSNTDEGWSFGARGANTTEQTKALLAGLVPSEHLDALLRLYPDVPALGCPFNTGDLQPSAAGAVDFFSSAEMPSGLQNKRVAAIVGDVMLAAGPRWLAQVASREVAVFKYRFNHVPYSTSSGVQDYVGHFVEVPYVFNLQNDETAFWKEHGCTATYLGPGAPTGDRSLGIAMSRAWASFIATGDPNEANVPGQTHWPPYSEGARNLVWQTRGSVVENDNYREEGIQFIVENIVF